MKKMLAIIALVAFLAPSAVLAQMEPASVTEKINDFSSFITVNTDASINVRETIRYDFGPYERHGIYRDIPIDYKTKSGDRVRLDLMNVSVLDENGTPLDYSVSTTGGNKRLKIGNANVLIRGVHTYVIFYKVPRVVGFFDGFDEIYWNVTGNGWQVPIKNAEATVVLPFTVDETNLKKACYAGATGSTGICDSIVDGSPKDNESTTVFKKSGLGSYEGMTVAVGFPKGFITPPSAADNAVAGVTGFFADGWWLLILPIVVFFWRFSKWRREGRDPKGKGVIIAQYDAPDGLSPMQVKFLLSQSFGNSLSAEIVYLATMGYLKISKSVKEDSFMSIIPTIEDYRLELLKPGDGLVPHDLYLLDSLFGNKTSVSLSSLKESFYAKATQVTEKIGDSLIAGGYFPDEKASRSLFAKFGGNFMNSRMWAKIVTALFLAFFGSGWIFSFTAEVLSDIGATLSVIAWVLAVAIWTFFSTIMPRMTEKGVATREHVQGFKLYLEVAEKDRINFHNAPAKNPQTFERFLPYAMALGVEEEWAKVFEGMDMPPMSWYNDPTMAHFNSVILASHLSSFSAMSTSNLSSVPGSHSGSGGGGFSGGGGGGGGGGSW